MKIDLKKIFAQKLDPLSEEDRLSIIESSSKQVGPGVFYSTIIVVTSFLPVFMLTGMEGKLFHPLAWTKTFILLIDAFLAITLTPVLISFLLKGRLKPEEANPILESKDTALITQGDKMFKVFSRPQIDLEDMLRFDKVKTYIEENNLDQEILEQAEIQVKYSGYIEKERNNADKLTRLEEVKIPEDFDYNKIKSMSIEAKQKLSKIKPATIAQASRISGVSPSDVSVLLIYMGR